MSRYLAIALLVLSVQAFAVYEVGDTVTNLCWKDAEDKSVCLDDYKDNVRVLLYNAGWCGPCNTEFQELRHRQDEFEGQPVKLLSLSSSGWRNGSKPDATFLKSWQQKHGVKFPVLASYKDAGKNFIKGPIYIPNVAVIDASGKLSYAAVNPGVEKIFAEVKKALSKR